LVLPLPSTEAHHGRDDLHRLARGGTTELGMLIKSDFTAAFQQHWQNELQKPWSSEVAATFFNPKTSPADAARVEFLKSSVGIGVDLFFGGGPH